ncbi:hypothetical protein MKX03_006344 [Papaver bracteatum]|nr:hypothetical protein MKX03_006344 [Papaver bracteatum]
MDSSEDSTMVASSLLPLASVSQQPYVSELLSFTLERLHKEPELLRVNSERIRRQMQEVAVGNYRAFIAAADALVAIREQVSAVDKHLEATIMEKRKLNRKLLANHSTLLDLLEIPQCVRNGNYDEALDLEAFVCKMSTMHPKLPVIQAVAAEVAHTTQSLLSQLLQKLRSNIQLPECLRIIGHLHRIGVFTESEMRLQYCAMGLGWVGLDFRGLLPPLFEDAVLNLFSKNMATAVENFQVVLDSHRWVAALPTGFSTNGPSAESQEDVPPPSYLMEHPPLAIFVNGVSAAMNELRPCAPVSLKLVLAQEVIKGLRAVSDSLMFLFDGVSQLLAVAAPPPPAPTRELPRVVNESGENNVSKNNSDLVAVENGVSSDAQAELSEQSETPEVDGSEQTSTPAEKQGGEEA